MSKKSSHPGAAYMPAGGLAQSAAWRAPATSAEAPSTKKGTLPGAAFIPVGGLPASSASTWVFTPFPPWPEVSAPRILRRDVHVTIATVPWRIPSVNRLLQEVAWQTVRPGHVHLFLDGHELHEQPDVGCLTWEGLEVHVYRQRPARGAGERWRVVERLPARDIVVNIDDDLCIGARHVEHMVAAVEGGECAVSGGGNPTDAGEIDCTSGELYSGPLINGQAGTMALRAGMIAGISQFPMADELLGMMGDDEGLVSAKLWKGGYTLRRVVVPVRYAPLAHDRRSQCLAGGNRCNKFRARLSAATGWGQGRYQVFDASSGNEKVRKNSHLGAAMFPLGTSVK